MIQGILLAAGEGRRFKASHPDNTHIDKLLVNLPNTEVSVLAHSANVMQQALANCVAVVRPHQLSRQQCLAHKNLDILTCEKAANGMGDALSYAVAKTSDASAWLIMLADMPWISPEVIAQLCQQFLKLGREDVIILPTYQGQQGHPVLFGAHWRDQLVAINGDRGAKSLIAANSEHVVTVPWNDDSILLDIDVLADLNREC